MPQKGEIDRTEREDEIAQQVAEKQVKQLWAKLTRRAPRCLPGGAWQVFWGRAEEAGLRLPQPSKLVNGVGKHEVNPLGRLSW